MRGEEIVREHFPVWERQQREVLAGEEFELGGQALQVTCRVHDDYVEAMVASGGLGEGERCSAALELVPPDLRSGGGWD